jgi:hypothetical protein
MATSITAANAQAKINSLLVRQRSLQKQLRTVNHALTQLQQVNDQYRFAPRVREMAAEFDKLGIPLDATQRQAKPLARAAGLRASNEIMVAALKYRRLLASVSA